jgi:SAM-dependent methyltransferase
MRPFQRLVKGLALKKASKIVDHSSPYLYGRVLDLGAGRCYIAREIEKRLSLTVTCVDVKPLGLTELPLILYDGIHIPLGDSSHDCVLLAYVLHHCNRPIRVLKEAIRVCKGNLVIFEDDESILRKPQDFFYNRLHSVDTPFNFKSEKDWLDVFDALDLELVAVKRGVEKEWFYPFVPHTMYVLRVKKLPGTASTPPAYSGKPVD